MSDSCFDVEVTNKVGHIRLNRPDQLNSMVREFWVELPEIVRSLDARGDVRAIVVSSTGRHFCAGMDLGVFTSGDTAITPGDADEMGRVRARLRQTALMLQESFTAFEKARMPVLAAIQGGCIGGAVDMVTAADMRYASADAFFVIQEINIGMTADVGTLQRLPKIIPDGVARELAYTGRRMSAQRALEVGLVNQVFPTHEELVAGVLEIASEIASKSPLAVWGTKEMLLYSRDHSVADGLNHIATWQTGMFQPSDMVESFAAKAEGRETNFPDLLPVPKEF
ncbi:MAG: crotonase/enoyl-CoA hydratase family protein [Actinobacteria bacterium]|nr:crotonase/enoyl-CoA hydratase family protein [Actinomycetota bacterium]